MILKLLFSKFKQPVLYFSLLALLIGCSNENPSNTNDDEENQPTGIEISSTSISGYYHNLFCDSTEYVTFFKYVPNGGGSSGVGSLVLKNIIEDSTFNLHGWINKVKNNKEFEDTPRIKFNVGKISNVTFQPGSYLGDFISGRKLLEDIYDSLTKGTNKYYYVVLEPQQDTLKGQIKYKVKLSKDPIKPKEAINSTLDEVGEFNPIPPKGSKEIQ